MNRLQKHAYFNIVAIVVLAILLITLQGLRWKYNILPESINAGHLSAFSLLYLCGASLLSCYYFNRRPEEIDLDERDEYIRNKSMRISLYLYFLFFSVGMMTPFFWMGASGRVSVLLGPVIFVGSIMFYMFVFSVVVLILYGKDNNTEGGTA